MRLSMFVLLLISHLTHAGPAKAEAFVPVFELAGIRLLCEQSAPLLTRGLSEQQQAQLGAAFAADELCLDLARQLAGTFDQAHLQQIQSVLGGPVAQRFSEAERSVGEGGGEALASYRAQLAQRPPREDRLALLALMARGESLDEQALSRQTASQAAALHTSSAEAVASFMLYAYRQMPSAQLAEYAALYEQPMLKLLLERCVQVLPQLFAERREMLRKAPAKQ